MHKSSAVLIQILLDNGAVPTETVLLDAIQRDMIDVVKILLEHGVRVTTKSIEEAAGQHREMFQLIQRYADGRIMDKNRSNAFMAAMRHNVPDVITLLSGTELQSGTKLTQTIEAVVGRGDIDTMSLLLGTNSQYRDDVIISLGCSLRYAVDIGQDEMIELLLDSGADVNRADLSTNSTPLSRAIMRRDVGLVQRLLNAGASVNTESRYSSSVPSLFTITVLPTVVAWGHRKLVHDIVDAGAEIDAPENESMDAKTALTIAVEKGDWVITQLLIDKGADVNNPAAVRTGHTALVAAIQNNDRSLVNYLLELGANIDELALTKAVSKGSDLVQALLSAQLTRTPRRPNSFGCRALQHAIVDSNKAVIQCLLKSGVDVNVIVRRKVDEARRDERKLISNRFESPFGTVLRVATNLDVVKMFLDNGANVDAISSESTWAHETWTPLLMAINRKHHKLVDMLIDAGASVNMTPRMNSQTTRTPLQAAVEVGAIDIVKLLVAKGADVNSPPHRNSGATALQLAAIEGYIGIATFLLNHGADVNAQSAKFNGRTALEGASEHGRIDMVQLLLSVGAMTTGTGEAQYDRALDLAIMKGHIAVRRLLEKVHAQHLEDS